MWYHKDMEESNEEKVRRYTRHLDDTDKMIEQVVGTNKSEFMSAFNGKYDVRKRNTIHNCFGNIVEMWQKGYSDGIACSYADLNLNTFNKYLQQYDAWAKKKYDEYDIKENPMRIIKKAVRSLEQDKKLLPAEESATPSQLLKIHQYRERREAEAEKEKADNPKRKKQKRRGRVEIDMEKLQMSSRDLRKMNQTYKPVALKSGEMTDAARALYEQREGER